MNKIQTYFGIFLIVSSMDLPTAVASENSIQNNGDLCALIKNHANAGTLQDLVTGKISNVQIGQQRVDLEAGEGGTAHVPYVQALDTSTHAPLNIGLLQEAHYWGGDHLGFVTQNNIVQILHYRDFHHPVSTIPVNGGTACNFKVTFKEILGTNAKEPELCTKLIDAEILPPISFTTKAEIDGQTYIPADSKIYGWLASGTSIGNMGKIDFANNGVPRNVVEMSIASSAGAGCDETFYDLLDDTGNHLALSDNMRLQLMELQNVDLQDVFPIRATGSNYAACGNKPRFFSYENKVYFENKSAQWPPIDNGNSYHRVTRVDNGKVVDVCDFSFQTQVQ